MPYMFNECSSLASLPDISKWIIDKVKYMGFMLNGCFSLVSVQNMKKWDISNIDINYISFNCFNSMYVPEKFNSNLC